MPSELEELVGFMGHQNPQVRLLAMENLVPFSTAQPSIFKANNLQPVKNLKVHLLDDPKIAEHAITILVNLSGDAEVLKALVSDQEFVDRVYAHIVNPAEPNANLLAMLLANMAKWDGMRDVLEHTQPAPEGLGSDSRVINQLMDLFVRGADGLYNKNADYDYLAYFFADIAKHADVRRYLVAAQPYDNVVPLTKIRVFTEHRSDVRRKGVASTIKNTAFDTDAHPAMLDEDEINLLPYLLLPLAGNESYDEDETMDMLPDLQLLPPDKQRDPDTAILQTHVETLTLLATTRPARELMRTVQVYPLIRETHLHVEDENLREACDRLVQLLMRDEAPEEDGSKSGVTEVEEEDDDDRIVPVKRNTPVFESLTFENVYGLGIHDDSTTTPTVAGDVVSSAQSDEETGGSSGAQADEADAPVFVVPEVVPPTLPYCTQKCLLGLCRGLPLDEACPNVVLHRAASTPESVGGHPLSAEDVCERVVAQLGANLEDSCECLDRYGMFGAKGYGYTFVAKGVQRADREVLVHEAEIYQGLVNCQGVLMPVFLGQIDLWRRYPLHSRIASVGGHADGDRCTTSAAARGRAKTRPGRQQ